MKKQLLFIAVLLVMSIGVNSMPNVPYFFQYYNSYNPGGSCQNTTIAMLLKYYGDPNVTPDDISNYWGTTSAQSVPGYDNVFNSEAASRGLNITSNGTYSGTFAQLHSLLAQGIPVTVHGDFTASGHLMILLAYDGTNYICNDPAGEWSQQYQYGGYCQCNGTAGNQVVYDAANMDNAIGPDGNLWIHWFTGPQPGTGDPLATLDTYDCSSIQGWAYDPDVPNNSIDVHIYIDGNGYNTGPTSVYRQDVNDANGISGDHGFDFTIPDSYKDCQTHTADIYAINQQDGADKLISSITFGPCYQTPTNLVAAVNTCPNIGVTLNWQGSGNCWIIDISTDPNFPSGSFWNASVPNATSVNCPGGFLVYPNPANPTDNDYLSFQPNTTYYWRINNGNGVTSTYSFTTPVCRYDLTTCSGTFEDTGGAGNPYTGNEDYSTVITPPNAGSITLNFTSFDLEDQFDYMYIYDWDGTNINTAVPAQSASGATAFTGNTIPGTFTAYKGSFLIGFKSDPAVHNAGWTATWSCQQSTTGIEEAKSEEILISPNPSDGLFSVELPKYFINTSTELVVFNVVGKEIIHEANPKSTTTIDLSEQAKGIYMMRITSEGKNYFKKIIVK